MREIKFRGLRTDGKGWIYGFYSPVNIPILGTLGHCINEGGYRAVDIQFESLGQFTGLKDINGKEIFDGDILQWTSYKEDAEGNNIIYNNVVEFYEGVNYIGYRLRNKGFAKRLTGRAGVFNAKAVIIGNIHENPELLS